MPSSSLRWVITLRDAIKREHGLGWSVREISSPIQLTRRFDDGTRSSVTLDLPWSPASTTSALSGGSCRGLHRLGADDAAV